MSASSELLLEQISSLKEEIKLTTERGEPVSELEKQLANLTKRLNELNELNKAPLLKG